MAQIFPALRRPLLFAHRGASAFAPENTWDAFELGHRLGAPVLELDVHLSRDGQVVVIHDATVDRTTNGTGPVRDKTYSELADLDAGYHFTRGDQVFPFRDQGCRLPLLSEVLAAFPDAAFNIEIKQRQPTMIRPVLDLLEGHDPANVLLAASDDAIMTELEAARPGCALGLSVGQVARFIKATYLRRSVEELRGRALQIPPSDPAVLFGLLPITTRAVIRKAHASGLEVHLFTLDDPKSAKTWLAKGVDGIMSNDPAALAPLFDAPKPRVNA
ncbi:MAG: glycerophosphodiester phosphodiesterase [Deltaproteobacteria bacterium]|nr:glycerophosphodiester phosphodiesterase [Deltaproteobacteria bacterium]